MKLLSKNFLYITRSSITSLRTNIFRSKSDEAPKQIKQEEKVDLEKNIIIEKYEGVTTISIDRTETRNSLDVATLRELSEALDDFEKDQTAKVLILNGEGGSFSAGYDFDEMEKNGFNALLDASARFRRQPLCYKTTVAAVSGYAVAEGFTLALACDLRIVEESAVLGFLGRRFGVPLSVLGSQRLASLIGLSRALDLIITGRLISGTEAFNRGLATKCTSTGTALGEAVKLAKSLVKFPQSALILDKLAAIQTQLNPNSEDSMRNEAMTQNLMGQAMVELKEGIAKFQRGIGKHGKFYQLTEVPLKDWELEDSTTEIIVGSGPKPSKTEIEKLQAKSDDKK